MMTQTQNNFGALWPKRLNGHFLLQGAELFREDAFFRAHVYVPTTACIFINQRHASWILVVTCQVYHFLFSAFIFGKCCPDAAFTRSLSLRNFWCKAPEQCRERERERAAISFGAPRLLRFASDLHRKLQQNHFFITLCTACVLSCIFSLCTRISNVARLRPETAQTASRDACAGPPSWEDAARRPQP